MDLAAKLEATLQSGCCKQIGLSACGLLQELPGLGIKRNHPAIQCFGIALG